MYQEVTLDSKNPHKCNTLVNIMTPSLAKINCYSATTVMYYLANIAAGQIGASSDLMAYLTFASAPFSTKMSAFLECWLESATCNGVWPWLFFLLMKQSAVLGVGSSMFAAWHAL